MPTYKITDKKTGKSYKVTGSRAPTQQEVVSLVSSKQSVPTSSEPQDGFLKTAGKAIAAPFVGLGKNFAEAGFQAGRFATDKTFRQGVMGKDLTEQQHRYLATLPTSKFMDEDKLGSRKDIAKDVFKNWAGVSSNFIPAGTGMQGALVQGAISGGLRGAYEGEDIDAGNILKGAGAGGLTAGVMYGGGKLIKGAASKVADKADDVGKSQYNRTFKEPIKDTKIKFKKGGTTLGEEAYERGIGGKSNEAIYKKAYDNAKSLNDRLTKILEQSDGTVNMNDIEREMNPYLLELKNSGQDGAFNSLVKRMESIKRNTGGVLSDAQANEVKRSIYTEVSNAYGSKSANEGTEGLKQVARFIKENIETNNSGVAEIAKINKDLGFWRDVEESMLDRIVREGRKGVLGLSDYAALGTGAAAAPITGGASLALPAAKILGGTTVGQTASGQAFKGIAGSLRKSAQKEFLPTFARNAIRGTTASSVAGFSTRR